jgi:hypothetical protein
MTPARFTSFFQIWADLMGWNVPKFHLEVCRWLDDWAGYEKVLRMMRGGAKSTIVGCKVAHDVYEDPGEARILAQGADDKVAVKMSRHARQIVRRHPLCAGLFNRQAWGVFQWWVLGNDDERNPSCAAGGILSNVTSSRATKVIFDDIEVPKNIKTPEAREALRDRISESTHILVPGGHKLYIGTPHTVESIYTEKEADGADCLSFPLFAKHKRYENEKRELAFGVPWKTARGDLYVFHGKRLLAEGIDYRYHDDAVHFAKTPLGTVDVYAGNIWPERFDRVDIQQRRKACRTVNEWDSQYGLHARPIHEIRLDPDGMIGYTVEPEISYINRECIMRLGKVRIVCATTWWDVALGKVKADASAFVVIFEDEQGRYYWHVAEGLLGDLDTQCARVREICVGYQLSLVNVEVNAVGGFVPAVLRKHLAGTGVAVGEHLSIQRKDKRILDGLEGPLAARALWGHVRLWDGPAIAQMRDWIPGVIGQPDDYIDAAASAILQAPVRIGKIVGSVVTLERHQWRPVSGVYNVDFKR